MENCWYYKTLNKYPLKSCGFTERGYFFKIMRKAWRLSHASENTQIISNAWRHTARYHTDWIIGCVRLAPLSLPRCVAVFFLSRTNVGNYLHTFVLEKKNSTPRGRPREAKRTHPLWAVRCAQWFLRHCLSFMWTLVRYLDRALHVDL